MAEEKVVVVTGAAGGLGSEIVGLLSAVVLRCLRLTLTRRL